MSEKYLNSIVRHYEDCLDKHGDNHLGVDWPKIEDVNKRYRVMVDIVKFANDTENVSLLDFGCGAAHLLQYILDEKLTNLNYSGLDVSEKFISLSKKKFPSYSFYCLDILNSKINLPTFDYVILNGVFTEKRDLSFEEMWNYFMRMLPEIFSIAEKGIAFNVMSKSVEWEREDLFHVPTDLLINFMAKKLSREFIIRNDYGLYEYTTYLYK